MFRGNFYEEHITGFNNDNAKNIDYNMGISEVDTTIVGYRNLLIVYDIHGF